ncbi:hypothetical protein [Zhihengliuella halotolerans]|uniref:hypothetical protein n=1 Tax=Zhihengliuella halotolerans TaxID=370736 RepID=UPI000C80F7AE|nr:hypothetical protein [Zhihengliuella halotolerans]
MQERHERVLRAVVSALVSTFATACAHDLGGGHFPHPAVLGLVFAVAVPLCLVAGGRRVTLASLAAAVAAAQVLLHAAFTLVGPQVAAGALSKTLSTTTSGPHAHHLPSGALAQAAAEQAGQASAPATHMLGTHVLAGVATLVALRVGTEALGRMVAALLLATAGVLASGQRTARAVAQAAAAASSAVFSFAASGLLACALFLTGAGTTAGARWARRGAAGSTPAQLRSRLLAAALVLRGPPAHSSPRFHLAA